MTEEQKRGIEKGRRAKESAAVDSEMLEFIRLHASTENIVVPEGRGRGKADVIVNDVLYGEGKGINKINQAEKLEQCAGRLRMFYKQQIYWLIWLSAGDEKSRRNWPKAVINFEETAGESLARRYIFLDPTVDLKDTVTFCIENGALVQRELLSEYIRATTVPGQTL